MALFRSDKPRELTGRAVLIWLIGFFGLVFVVNGIMAKAAISTFGGVETQSSYKAGQMFEHEVALARAQDSVALARRRQTQSRPRGRSRARHDRARRCRPAGRRPQRRRSALAPGRFPARSRHPDEQDRPRRLPRRSARAVRPLGTDRRLLPRRQAHVPLAQRDRVEIPMPVGAREFSRSSPRKRGPSFRCFLDARFRGHERRGRKAEANRE